MNGEMTKRLSPYRAMRHLRKNGLNRALHIADGEEIPEDRLITARDTSKNEHVKRMAEFAGLMRGLKK